MNRSDASLYSSPYSYLVVFFVAIVPRIIIATLYPYKSGDWPIVYKVVAENILFNHCVSQSLPSSGLCLPHWGGNQLPGFPFFAAVAWALSGKQDLAILAGQSVVAALAIVWMMRAVKELTGSSRIALAGGMVLALSPVSAGWARSLNTETLALATTTWVLAELLMSLAQRRLRILPLGLALSSAVFIRYDSALLCTAVALCAFLIHRPWQAIRRGVCVAMILMVPLAAWSVRSVSLGLTSLPTFNVPPKPNSSGQEPYPGGYRQYGLTLVVNSGQIREYMTRGFNGAYSKIRIPDSVFDNDSERKQVQSLLAELAIYDGKAFPKHIDDAFGVLAAERYEHDPWRQLVTLPLKRVTELWINPFSSWGWPIGFEDSDTSLPMENKIERNGAASAIELALEYPGLALGKAVVNGYLFLLLGLFIGLIILLPRVSAPYLRAAFAIVGLIAVARSAFFVAIAAIESRYLVESIPGMEIVVVMGCAALWQQRTARQFAFSGRANPNQT